MLVQGGVQCMPSSVSVSISYRITIGPKSWRVQVSVSVICRITIGSRSWRVQVLGFSYACFLWKKGRLRNWKNKEFIYLFVCFHIVLVVLKRQKTIFWWRQKKKITMKCTNKNYIFVLICQDLTYTNLNGWKMKRNYFIDDKLWYVCQIELFLCGPNTWVFVKIFMEQKELMVLTTVEPSLCCQNPTGWMGFWLAQW